MNILNKQHYSWIVFNLQPLLIFNCGFCLLGVVMHVGQRTESIRQELGIPVWQMCNILAIKTDITYFMIKTGHVDLDLYQKLVFVIITERPLE